MTTYRDLHALSSKLHEQLTASDATTKISLPELDNALLESIESPDQKQKGTAGKTRPNGRSAGSDVIVASPLSGVSGHLLLPGVLVRFA